MRDHSSFSIGAGPYTNTLPVSEVPPAYGNSQAHHAVNKKKERKRNRRTGLETVTQLAGAAECSSQNLRTSFYTPRILFFTVGFAIIEAGSSGLISIKQCLEGGVEPVRFEALGDSGGQWDYTDPDPQTGEVVSSIYRSAVMSSSRKTLIMNDIPLDPNVYAMYADNSKVQQCFESYAEFFKLQPYIRPNHRTQGAYQAGGGESGGEVMVDTHDAVFVCTSHHSTPNVPDWQGVDEFEGELVHSRCYRDPVKSRGKDVAVVGVGNSGADISTELSTCTKSTHLITRSGIWAWPRFVFGEPYEDLGSRFMLSVVPRCLAMAIARWVLGYTLGAIPKELKPEHKPLGAHPTARSDLIERISTGTISPHRGSIKRFTKRGVELTNGEMVEPLGAVVAATGYTLNFPFLPKGVVRHDEGEDGKENWADLYRLIVAPGHPGLYFIGLCQPLGALMPVSEMQARWATSTLKNEILLPSPEQMCKDIAAYQNDLGKGSVTLARHTLGRFLSTFGVWQDVKTAWGAYFGPPSGAQYRLFGRGRKEELARLVLQRLARGGGEETSAEEIAEVERYR
ncbi:flavin monooxygenase-like protein [Tuber brumale]|nr:flavin monooxygenase-like protein [Tuber brumale]